MKRDALTFGAKINCSIQRVRGSATLVKVLVDEVDVGSQKQTRGIEQIAMAVTAMETVTLRSAAGAEESAAVSQELAAPAKALCDIVERVRQLAGNTGNVEREDGTRRSSPHAGHFMAVAPRARAGRSYGVDAFPLDGTHSF